MNLTSLNDYYMYQSIYHLMAPQCCYWFTVSVVPCSVLAYPDTCSIAITYFAGAFRYAPQHGTMHQNMSLLMPSFQWNTVMFCHSKNSAVLLSS